MKRHLWLSGVLVIALAMFLAALAACAAEATPTPTPLPPGVTPTPRPPTPTPLPKGSEQIRYEESLKEYALIEAAGKKEGKVFIYSSYYDLRPTLMDQIDIFKKLYPEIKVEGLRTAGGVYEKMRAETIAKKRVNDILLGTSSPTYSVIIDGSAVNYVPPNILDPSVQWHTYPKLEGMDNPLVSLSRIVYTPVINTSMMRLEDAPKTWKETADPKWKNRIVISNPSGGGIFQLQAHGLLKLYGEDFLRALLGNLIITEGSASRAVALGEYPMTFDSSLQSLTALPGAPVKLIYLEEGVAFAATPSMILMTMAPNPNAGKLFINVMLSKEAGDVFAKEFMPYRADVTVTGPELDPTKIKQLPDQPPGLNAYINELPVERTWYAKVLKGMGKM